jgi:methionine-gamma-lyase
MRHVERLTTLLHSDPSPASDGTGAPFTPPIVMTTGFHYPRLSTAEAVAHGERSGYLYTRVGNPTLAAVEQAVSVLEGAEASLLLASGMSAITTTLLTLLRPGSHVVVGLDQYGGTYSFLNGLARKFVITFTPVDAANITKVERSVREQTGLLFVETIGNPTTTVAPIDDWARIAHHYGIPLVVDNTLASGVLLRPLQLGASLVVNSASKYMNGHGDNVIGTVSGPRDLVASVRESHHQLGGVVNPLAAYLLWRGLSTVHLRVQAHSAGALTLAAALETRPGIRQVRYPGLPTHPQHTWVKRHFEGGHGGGVMAIEVTEDVDLERLVDSLRLFHRAVSLGDPVSLIEQPSGLTHRSLGERERRAMGLTDRWLRLSVGLEPAQDLIADWDQALAKALQHSPVSS